MDTNTKNQDGADSEVLAKIAKFSDEYRSIGERLHEVIMQAGPKLYPRLWYGMPGYAQTKDGAVICFFREDKYVTFGITENADFAWDKNAPNQLKECAWFLTALNDATEQKISSIVREITS